VVLLEIMHQPFDLFDFFNGHVSPPQGGVDI
jgi:hypothetical protein